MTKLFSRTFSSSPGDAKLDLEISEKMNSLQTFLKPEHLDIPSVLRNDASWLVSMHADFRLIFARHQTFVEKALFSTCIMCCHKAM